MVLTNYAGPRRVMGLIAGAAALMIVGAGLYLGIDSSPDPPDPPAAPESESEGTGSPAEVPPEETKYVGVGRAAIAVPQEWDYSSTNCAQAGSDSYFFPDDAGCPRAELAARTSFLVIVDSEHRLPNVTRIVEPVDGRKTRMSDVECDRDGCGRYIWMPGLEAGFRVWVANADDGREGLDRMVASLTVVEPGVRPVPDTDVHQRNERQVTSDLYLAGLTADLTYVECPPNWDCAPGVTSVQPAPGTLVPVGSAVRVEVLVSDLPTGVPTPPEGMKYVARGRVLIAVPEEWRRRRLDCLAWRPTPTTRSGGCRPWSAPSGSRVEFAPESEWDKRWRSLRWRSIDGFRAREVGVSCLESDPEVCLARLSIPALDAEFRVTVAGDEGGAELAMQMLNSVTVRPAGTETPRFVMAP